MTELFTPVDDFDRRLVLHGAGSLAGLNAAGVLTAADVHTARTLARLCGTQDPDLLAVTALTVRATRTGSVCLDLTEVPATFPDRAWPDPEQWLATLAASPLVEREVLRLEGPLVYLDRYWQDEGAVVDDLRTRAALPPPEVDQGRLRVALDLLFGDSRYEQQRSAAESSARRRTSVLIGGPGTGKTATLARLLALLSHLEDRPLRIALAAPTGKAAARLSEAIAQAAADPSFPDELRAHLDGLTASTLHRLLGTLPDTGTRFRHHRGNRLLADVVVVDETSMVSLSLMARLMEAVRPEARLVLVGDADQLASVEAGAVLRNLVDGLAGASDSPVSELTTVHRFGPRISALATAIREQDEELTLLALRRPEEAVREAIGDGRLPLDPGVLDDPAAVLDAIEWIDPADEARIKAVVAPHAVALSTAASRGDDRAIVDALGAHRLLCAHRDGPYGVSHWNRVVERWLLDALRRDWLEQPWYAGQPLLVNSNDYGLRLWNGDTGVVTANRQGQTPRALFADGTPEGRSVPLSRLGDVQTAHAMTVHRAQGSQFTEVTVLLPPEDSPLATRELLYTAITRASRVVRVIGDEPAVRAAVGRQVRRATGLARRLHNQGDDRGS